MNSSSWVRMLGERAGVSWFDYQLDCFDAVADQDPLTLRLCLYYKTGAGKTVTALACLMLAGYTEAVVIAPPSTHDSWEAQGAKLGVTVTCMSHATFRMPKTKLSRHMPVVADEFHLFGGHQGKGWKKLDALARGLKSALILASATPNYNDAERVYCIQHVLDPNSVKGGYLEFLYRECETEQDHFSMTPKVLGFRRYADAAEYLADLYHVQYLPDDLVYTIDDFPIQEKIPAEMTEFGLNPRKRKMIASIIEERHARVDLSMINEDGAAHKDVADFVIDKVYTAVESVLIFANHSTVAEALSESLNDEGIDHALVTGATSKKQKAKILDEFRSGATEVLIGTASLATGPDGLDKVCDTLVIVDDTEDDALRRQLIGRIMPRGADTDASMKHVYRLVLQ